MKRLLLSLALILVACGARAELLIEIIEGVDNPTTIAVSPFAWRGAGAGSEDIAQVVQGDLARSGQFAPVDRKDMLSRPGTEKEVFYRDWRAISAEYLLIGRVATSDQMRIEFELFDVNRQTRVLEGVESGPVSEARMLAHRVSDQVYEKLTGIRGAFATRLLYVSVIRNPGSKDYY
ncbi:MAG: Tol-Pal system protein TolB, partial [Parahaliea sp.]